ncbi:DUF7000 family protein [Alkalibacterium olivapovliticus]|uniref:DUF7000 domain-containing protein n=1 Tax=Alkalibacterium olivapovliticus TaxID=99907 RepID=A0A2T0W857_9LACT|nr:hypothetical protein [Alkalibacterium olivapovliticus]PRY82856.1 hypothetical protein CLV38_10866 [Alkalibacterium olivapovliticus]
MDSLDKHLWEFRTVLKETNSQQAYKGLILYIKELRNYFKENYPEYDVSSNFYQGYMDLTFFTLRSQLTKQKDLKYIVVFTYEHMQFEVWLAGRNRAVMSNYHTKFSHYQMKNYTLTDNRKGMSAILENVVVEHPNFDQLKALTKQIDAGVIQFIQSIETDYLSDESD